VDGERDYILEQPILGNTQKGQGFREFEPFAIGASAPLVLH
jgi:hypothetical protein